MGRDINPGPRHRCQRNLLSSPRLTSSGCVKLGHEHCAGGGVGGRGGGHGGGGGLPEADRVARRPHQEAQTLHQDQQQGQARGGQVDISRYIYTIYTICNIYNIYSIYAAVLAGGT